MSAPLAHLLEALTASVEEIRLRGPCPFCGRPMLQSTPTFPSREHLTPRSRGGDDSAENVVIVCNDCNNHKGDDTLLEYLFRGGLLGIPGAVTLRASYRPLPPATKPQHELPLSLLDLAANKCMKEFLGRRRTQCLVAWTCFQLGAEIEDIAQAFMSRGLKTPRSNITQMIASIGEDPTAKCSVSKLAYWTKCLKEKGHLLPSVLRPIESGPPDQRSVLKASWKSWDVLRDKLQVTRFPFL